MEDLWLGDDLRSQLRVAEDPWQFVTSKLTEQTKMKGERMNNLDISRSPTETKLKEKSWVQEDNKYESLNFRMMNFDMKMNETTGKASLRNGLYNMNVVYPKNNLNTMNNYNMSIGKGKVINSNVNKEANNNGTGNNGNNNNNNAAVDKRFKTLPSTEMLPRNEVLGGYIFVCNNDTMQEDLKRQLFGILCFRIQNSVSLLLLELHRFCILFCCKISDSIL
ncbi:hypothetical protein QJS10_CPB11g01288 [Acorus calamus]|uniref:DCD domain-containing protein n=1 Tax=Acorus calamus TaxID=4465 RepID=A0AAV9DT40_ACOCL|nr:hypothetical protein QJS10_CPB11g01288 [Acorus calamus]